MRTKEESLPVQKKTSAPVPHPNGVDFNRTPFVAIWEITRACDLACRHCRAEAIPQSLPGELSTTEGFRLLKQLAAMGTPICVLSGGDPAKRDDLCELVREGKRLGMRMATIPAATPLLTRSLVRDLREAGLDQMALSVDGPTRDIHDTFSGVPGSFDLTLRGAGYALDLGLPLQVNTTFSAYNWHCLDAIAGLVQELEVVFWEVFFLVPMGRGSELGQMNAQQFEDLFSSLARFARQVDFIVKITEAPHYRRYMMQEFGARKEENRHHHGSAASTNNLMRGMKNLPPYMRRDFGPAGSIGLAPKGVNAGKGHLFVSYCGEIYPSGFLPLCCGNVREDPLADIYRSHPVFCRLRNPDLLKGKCGICEFRHFCGGSRSRAYAMTGDYLAEEPFCLYEPPSVLSQDTRAQKAH